MVAQTSQALRAMNPTHRPRPASSRPQPGRWSGVNADASNITAPSATLPQSLASSLGGSSAARPCGFAEGSVMSGAPAHGARCRLRQRRFNRQHARSRYRANARVYPGAARKGGGTSPRPPGVVCCAGLQRCALLAPCSQPRTRPPQGAPRKPRPEAERQPRNVGGKAPAVSPRRVAPCSPRQGFASPLRALDPAATRR